ncbi:hypothetical protein BJ138DRAFT_130302 [Hygrophoropsis aurantiaca]|uniref:Uncharacterized protein n=1 Tax=Hygrophoropsis aurantiaca TaxID=72124 RepID=A0ACB8ABY1_9AGAM|nr:hypothetical protein BJ138DRAFT_130302 [Hygrophoropsis aurantiaca]
MFSNQRAPPTRFNAYHSTKRQLLGNQAGAIPPAWKDSKDKQKEQGSKILLSRLPPDVGEPEVEELFQKTVGPLKEAFLIHNSQGRSKGMAVVVFQRRGDAAVARAKYDGKFIDGRRPIKIEIVVDSNEPAQPPPAAPTGPSLLGRIGGTANNINGFTPTAAPKLQPPQQPRSMQQFKPLRPSLHPVQTNGAFQPRIRHKKGPRRTKKASAAQLDEEMDSYRAADPQRYDSVGQALKAR